MGFAFLSQKGFIREVDDETEMSCIIRSAESTLPGVKKFMRRCILRQSMAEIEEINIQVAKRQLVVLPKALQKTQQKKQV